MLVSKALDRLENTALTTRLYAVPLSWRELCQIRLVCETVGLTRFSRLSAFNPSLIKPGDFHPGRMVVNLICAFQF